MVFLINILFFVENYSYTLKIRLFIIIYRVHVNTRYKNLISQLVFLPIYTHTAGDNF